MTSAALVPLRELAELKSGGTPSKSRKDYWDGDIPWISGKTLHDTFVNDSDLRITEAGLSAGSNLAPVHSSLILVRGMSLLQEIRIGMATRPVAFNQDVKAVVARPTVRPRYLNLALRAAAPTLLDQVHQAGHGTGVLATDRLTDLPIWLPPLEEQERIAGVLGAFDDLIETNRRLIAGLDDLFQSLWRQDYSGRSSAPRQPLAAVASTQYGLTASASDDPTGVKFLRVTDINKQNWINWESVPTVPSSEVQGDKYRLRAGDLLVARMADPGKSAIYEGGPDAVFASYLVRLKPDSYEDGLYLYGFLKSADYEGYAAGAMTGSVQKNMNAKVISAATMNWPDESDRLAFAKKVAPIRAAQSSLLTEVDDLTRQRDELLPLLMSGKVRVRDVEAAVS